MSLQTFQSCQKQLVNCRLKHCSCKWWLSCAVLGFSSLHSWPFSEQISQLGCLFIDGYVTTQSTHCSMLLFRPSSICAFRISHIHSGTLQAVNSIDQAGLSSEAKVTPSLLNDFHYSISSKYALVEWVH